MTADLRELETYRDLLVAFEPRPLQTQEEVDRANDVIDRLTDLSELTDGQRDFVGLLAELIHRWEAEHDHDEGLAPHDKLRCLLEDNGLRDRDLVGPVFSDRAEVAAVLAGTTSLSYQQIRDLAAFFHVEPNAFFP